MQKRTHIKNLLILLSSVLAFFVLLELSLALFWPYKITTRQYHDLFHPVLGWTNGPDSVRDVKVARNIYFSRTHNKKGLRGLREFSYEKPAGVRRILLLGDSFFWGFGVDDKYVISEVLQQMVGGSIEVINGSTMGYGTDQELLWLREEGLKYRPDLVVLGFFPINDVDEISKSVMYGYPKPFFTLDGERLVLNNVPVPDSRETRRKAFERPDNGFGRLKQFMRYNTHTYQFIAGRLNSVPALRRFFIAIGIGEEFTQALPGIPVHILEPEKVQDLSNALIKEIKRASGEAGADFLLFHIPKKELGPAARAAYEGVDKDAAEWNSMVSSYLSGFTSANNIRFIDFLPVVRERHSRGEQLYNPKSYDHHWTPSGHRAAAETLSIWLKEKGWE